MTDTATLDLFAAPPVRRRYQPGQVVDLGWVKFRPCHKDPTQPHGVGHNSVCVCQCADCKAERGEA